MRRRPIIPHMVGKLWTPRNVSGTRTDNWPRCYVCKSAVERYQIYDRGSKRLEILAGCHGQEDVLRITWEQWGDKEPDWGVLGPHVASLVFFDPSIS